MMKVTKDLTYHLKNIQTSLYDEISKLENIEISEDNLKKIHHIKSNIVDIKEELSDYVSIVKLLDLLDTKNKVDFFLTIEKTDPDFFVELLKIINELNKSNDNSSKQITDKILSLYSISLIKNVFSENRIAALEVASNNYK